MNNNSSIISGYLQPQITPSAYRNQFVENNNIPVRRDPQLLAINVMAKGFQASIDIQRQTNDLIKFSVIRNELISKEQINILTQIKNVLANNNLPVPYSPASVPSLSLREQVSTNEAEKQTSKKYFSEIYKDMGSSIKSGFNSVTSGLKELQTTGFSAETLALLAVLAFKKLGFDGIHGVLDAMGLTKVINGFKSVTKMFTTAIEGFKVKGLGYLKDLGSKGIKELEKLFPNIAKFTKSGISLLENFGKNSLSEIKLFTKNSFPLIDRFASKSISIFHDIKASGSTAFASFDRISTKVFKGFESGYTEVNKIFKNFSPIIKSGLELIPGFKPLISLVKTIAKIAPVIDLLFAGYDFYNGYKKAGEITGDKNAGVGKKILAGGVNVATGFINAFSSAGKALTGYDAGSLSSKGIWQGLTHPGSVDTSAYNVGEVNNVGTPINGSPISNVTSSGNKSRGGRPIDGGTITSYPGSRISPTKGASSNHKGTDFGVPVGTPVYASYAGTVTYASSASGYGNVVYISHKGGFETRYAHLSKIITKAGQHVKEGDLIGLSGGGHGVPGAGTSTGPHLHYELRKNGVALNPFGGSNNLAKSLSNSIGGGDSGGSSSYVAKSSGANTSSAIVTHTASIKSNGSLADKAFSGIAVNEGSLKNPSKLTKDNVGYAVGLSQFNSSKNPNAWKKLGFSDGEIKAINSGNFDHNSVQARLSANSSKLAQMDMNQKDNLYSYVNNFFSKSGLDVSDPNVYAQLMDIANQYGEVFDGKTVEKLKNFSGGNKVTLSGIKSWRNTTLQASTASGRADQNRRFNNINSVMGNNSNKSFHNNMQVNTHYKPSYNNNLGAVHIASLSSNIKNGSLKYTAKQNKDNSIAIRITVDLGKNATKVIDSKSHKIHKEVQNHIEKQISAIKDINSNSLVQTHELLNSSKHDITITPKILNNALNYKQHISKLANISGLNNLPDLHNSLSHGDIGLDLIKHGQNILNNNSLVKTGKGILSNINMIKDSGVSIINDIKNPNLNSMMDVESKVKGAIPLIANLINKVGGINGKSIGNSFDLSLSEGLKEINPQMLTNLFMGDNKQKLSQPVINIPQQVSQKVPMDKSTIIHDFPLMAVLSGVFD